MRKDDVPQHLRSTYNLIACAFPDGIGDEDYLALLAILEVQMSDRNLADVVAFVTGRASERVLNDVYRVRAGDRPNDEVKRRVVDRLVPCGYDRWLKEEG